MMRFKHILVYVGADQDKTSISRANQLALENEARLTLMDVVKPVPRARGMLTNVAEPAHLERLVAQDHRDQLWVFRANGSHLLRSGIETRRYCLPHRASRESL